MNQPFGVVELLKGGQHRQHAAMMVMAMLGFYFEISRHDRDKYIRVHSRHIRPDKLHHFEKIREDATFPLPYDYKSATHPAWQFWRKIGKSGISTVATLKATDPDGQVMKSLGQNRQLLSDMDILKINSVYGIEWCFVTGEVEFLTACLQYLPTMVNHIVTVIPPTIAFPKRVEVWQVVGRNIKPKPSAT
ncbi:astacin (Peptidase family m12A) domain-containing protein [Phthorimaea operculella]|nr:astacin (Peptidase family m12A) domain-containing protein [Phthorimaea operculella]